MSEQQVLNYLHWLRERGQYFLVPQAPPIAQNLKDDENSGMVEDLEVAHSSVEAAVKAQAEEEVIETDRASVAESGTEKTIAVSAAEPLATKMETAPASVPKAEPIHPLKVIFLSTHPLDTAENEMVTRIAGALALQPHDFVMASTSSAAALFNEQTAAHIVIMGEDAMALVPFARMNSSLSISHPGAMLREPTLKVSAWNTLQKLKAAL